MLYDAASAISRGRRAHQEDAMASDFPIGTGAGFAVVADGMGGHAAGDVASKIAVTEVFSELKLQAEDPGAGGGDLPVILRAAAATANACIGGHAATHAETRGMGTTLLAVALRGAQLHWLSVGDSPLYLFREGRLRRINEDHSMAPQIDLMVESGLLSPEDGRDHPDRNCLTSVIAGQEIPRIDCPAEPFTLRPGDVLVLASDGLQFLEDDEIAAILRRRSGAPSARIAAELMQALEVLADPDQDNAALTVIQLDKAAGAVLANGSRPALSTAAAAALGAAARLFRPVARLRAARETGTS
jgi:protein phosphatase